MSTVYEIIFHKELNMLHCFCGFMGNSHHCTRKMKGSLKTSTCAEDCKVCEKEADRKKYNYTRWKTNVGGYLVCATSHGKLGSDPICTSCFCEFCYSSVSEGCPCEK